MAERLLMRTRRKPLLEALIALAVVLVGAFAAYSYLTLKEEVSWKGRYYALEEKHQALQEEYDTLLEKYKKLKEAVTYIGRESPSQAAPVTPSEVSEWLRSQPPGWSAEDLARKLEEKFGVRTRVEVYEGARYLFVTAEDWEGGWYWVTWRGLLPPPEWFRPPPENYCQQRRW